MSDDKQLLTAFAVLGAHIQALRDEGADLRDELAKLRRELAGVRDLAERRQQQLYEIMRDRDASMAANATLNKRVRELEAQVQP
jgi:predicted  nucleic acid-binding Zn-ribbon protein